MNKTRTLATLLLISFFLFSCDSGGDRSQATAAVSTGTEETNPIVGEQEVLSRFTLVGSGVFPSSSSRFSGKDWSFKIVYRDNVLPDVPGQFLTTYSSAIESFECTVGGERYEGLSRSSLDLGVSPVAGVVEVGGGGDGRMEFRGSAFLNGDPSLQEIEIFEIVFEDVDDNSLARKSLSGGKGLAGNFDDSTVDLFIFGISDVGGSNLSNLAFSYTGSFSSTNN